jgi:hypothetical protein
MIVKASSLQYILWLTHFPSLSPLGTKVTREDLFYWGIMLLLIFIFYLSPIFFHNQKKIYKQWITTIWSRKICFGHLAWKLLRQKFYLHFFLYFQVCQMFLKPIGWKHSVHLISPSTSNFNFVKNNLCKKLSSSWNTQMYKHNIFCF